MSTQNRFLSLGRVKKLACSDVHDLTRRIVGYAGSGENAILRRESAGRDNSLASRLFRNSLVQREIAIHLALHTPPGDKKLVVCSGTPYGYAEHLHTVLAERVPGLRVLRRSATEDTTVGLIQSLIEAGSDPLLQRARAWSAQDILNNAATVVHGIGRTVPTLLILSDVDGKPWSWLPSPPPAGLRIVLLASSLDVDGGCLDGLMNRGDSVVHFAPTTATGSAWCGYGPVIDAHPLGHTIRNIANHKVKHENMTPHEYDDVMSHFATNRLPCHWDWCDMIHDGCVSVICHYTRSQQHREQRALAHNHHPADAWRVADATKTTAGCCVDGSMEVDRGRSSTVSPEGGGAAAHTLEEHDEDDSARLAQAADAAVDLIFKLLRRFPGVFTPETLKLMIEAAFPGAPDIRPALNVLRPLVGGGGRAANPAENSVLGHSRAWHWFCNQCGISSADANIDPHVDTLINALEALDDTRLHVEVMLVLMRQSERQYHNVPDLLATWTVLSWFHKHQSVRNATLLLRNTLSAPEFAKFLSTNVWRALQSWKDCCTPAEYAYREIIVAHFSSQCGDFDMARTILLGLRRASALPMAGFTELLLALNEIRAWDSRRDWTRDDDLELLRESSTRAIELLRDAKGPNAALHISVALSASANFKFKVACLHSDHERDTMLTEADMLVAKSIRVLSKMWTDKVEVPSLALGVARLVGGVVSTVRVHGLLEAGLPAIEGAFSALDSFYAAEHTIRAGVAGPCELSIFTHGNLAETYFYSLEEYALGLFHFVKAVQLGAEVFGPEHINTQSKRRDLVSALERLGETEEASRMRDVSNLTFSVSDSQYPPGPYRFVLRDRGYLRASCMMGYPGLARLDIEESIDMLAVD
eukprot:m.173778 g.173778  ORF g.173778 m.173778 type:complete len:871 (-) comp13742_c0_seq1:197-2809(-)